MSGKNQAQVTLNWQSVDPRTGLLPLNNDSYGKGSRPSGVASQAITGTAPVYSQIVDVSRMDSLGLEIDWSGTLAGAIVVYGSVSGANWFDITSNFASPAISNPAGSAGGTLSGYKQYEYKYVLVKYTNATGSGNLTGYLQVKDLN